MASFSVPCPKTTDLLAASHSSSKHNLKQCNASLLFRSDFKSNRSLIVGSSFVQASSRKRSDVFKVCAQLNEVAIEKSDSSLAPENKEESTKKVGPAAIADAATITAFMNQVSDLVELVDSRDIMELQLKQHDCEVLIRKKEALPQPPAASYVMMQSPSPQMYAPQQQAAASTSPAPIPSPSPSPAPALPAPAMPKSSHPPMKCPMAGTFYLSPAPGAPAFVKVGDKVQKGQVICIVEAMKLMNEIEADRSGTITAIHAEDGKPVSVDTPLMVIEP